MVRGISGIIHNRGTQDCRETSSSRTAIRLLVVDLNNSPKLFLPWLPCHFYLLFTHSCPPFQHLLSERLRLSASGGPNQGPPWNPPYISACCHRTTTVWRGHVWTWLCNPSKLTRFGTDLSSWKYPSRGRDFFSGVNYIIQVIFFSSNNYLLILVTIFSQ